MEDMAFADWLTQQMQDRGLSKGGLEEAIGTTSARHTVKGWLHEGRLPRFDSQMKIARYLGVEHAEVEAAVLSDSAGTPEAVGHAIGAADQFSPEEIVRMRAFMRMLDGLSVEDIRCMEAMAQVLRASRRS